MSVIRDKKKELQAEEKVKFATNVLVNKNYIPFSKLFNEMDSLVCRYIFRTKGTTTQIRTYRTLCIYVILIDSSFYW